MISVPSFSITCPSPASKSPKARVKRRTSHELNSIQLIYMNYVWRLTQLSSTGFIWIS